MKASLITYFLKTRHLPKLTISQKLCLFYEQNKYISYIDTSYIYITIKSIEYSYLSTLKIFKYICSSVYLGAGLWRQYTRNEKKVFWIRNQNLHGKSI